MERQEDVTILFAGDSGDGMQLTGNQFTHTAALFGNDVSTFPNYPAEIRAPQGTLAGVSGFQVRFGSISVYTAGDLCDVLVVMNAAALKANLHLLKTGGTIIANSAGFDAKNLRLAKYEEGATPLQDPAMSAYRCLEMDITKMTRNALEGMELGIKDIDRCKNMFVLGFLYWMYDRNLDNSVQLIEEKFAQKPLLIEANTKALKSGYHYGDTSETFTSRYQVEPAKMPAGTYRNVMGNQATAMGLLAAAEQAELELFYGSYPITPASDILHELSKFKHFGVKTFQAEDEIAAVCAAIGASYGGGLGVTASSGPGIALKGEAIGLGVMLELPLVICSVQRGGPSTGLPTKTEQSDLLQALYGRNGEAPLVVVAAASPSDCFDAAFDACRIAIEHMIPVFFLSDGYIANGAEPWRFPQQKDLPKITTNVLKEVPEEFLPYERDDRGVRSWALPGTAGLEHRIGGLEKEEKTGNVSYEAKNHETMVKQRQEKVDQVANHIPLQAVRGNQDATTLVVGWGSTYGVIATAVDELNEEGVPVAQAHLRHLSPFPKNLAQVLAQYEKVILPEMNNGQLQMVLRAKFGTDIDGIHKIQGVPFQVAELKQQIKDRIG